MLETFTLLFGLELWTQILMHTTLPFFLAYLTLGDPAGII